MGPRNHTGILDAGTDPPMGRNNFGDDTAVCYHHLLLLLLLPCCDLPNVLTFICVPFDVHGTLTVIGTCLLYTSDAADE